MVSWNNRLGAPMKIDIINIYFKTLFLTIIYNTNLCCEKIPVTKLLASGRLTLF